MNVELGQFHRLLKDLKKYGTKQTLPVTDYKTKHSNEKGFENLLTDDTSWENYRTGDPWGGYDHHQWFRTKITIPPSFEGGKVVFRMHTGHPEGWDITNPQFLSYVNGELISGLDVNHREIVLTQDAKADTSYQISLLGYSGLLTEKVFLFSEIALLDETIIDFYYDFNMLFTTAILLQEDDMNREKILKDLRFIVGLLDLRKIYSEAFYASLKAASSYLKNHYYTTRNESCPVVTAIGHTHIDIAWMWSVSQTREKVARSFSTVLYLMELFPDYKFMSSQPLLYSFLKEEHPKLYEKVKQKVKEGRWEIDGGMWVEADCNLISGESIVRQLLHGTRFFEEEFGAPSHTLWLPDVFGYCAALPQILKKSGIDYFFTTKLDWNQFNRIPHDTFMWQGIDGSEVFTHFATTTNHVAFDNDVVRRENPSRKTTYNGRLNPNQVLGNWSRYQDKNLDTQTLQLFGFGDGGGGPTEEMLENAKRLQFGLPGLPRVEIDFQKNFFDAVYERVKENPQLSKWVGELYLEYHRGTYTSMAKNKRFNRKAEFLYQNVEMLSSLCTTLLNKPYPKEALDRCWKMILLNQFHDIIPGSSIESVYEQTDKEYAKLFEEGNSLLQHAMSALSDAICIEKESFIAFNTLSFERTELVTIEVPEGFSNQSIQDGAGGVYPVQRTSDGDKLLFLANKVPAKGYTSYSLVPETSHSNPFETSQFESHKNLETPFYRIAFDENYTFTSIWDKHAQREILAKDERGNKLEIFEDRPMDFENWDIDLYHLNKVYEVTGDPTATLIEKGPVRTCVEVKRSYYDSSIVQRIYFYAHTPRIDFDTKVDWHEKQVLLKASFPTSIHSDKARFEIQYGSVERMTHNNTSWEMAQFETCAHKWADLSERGYGVSLLNDCKYGHSIKENVMRLTLIKCGDYPNPHADQGEHTFTYSLYPHQKDWATGGTQQEAYSLNVPLLSTYRLPQQGSLDSCYSLFTLDTASCILEVVKQAEKGEGIILRVFEYTGARTPLTITSAKPLGKVYECDLLEKPIREITSSDSQFTDTLLPFEIKTYLLSLNS